ncbi:putative odorant receptor 69a [Drosophila tropicalis]|uniref:putative odorant receptor 69a n=1 Tax=Drosophila tropicalis TaxID=46794 RepID=UPI0035AB7317
MQLQLKNFMYYPDFACQVAGMQRYSWMGVQGVERQCELTVVQRAWFIFGALNLVYQNLGLIISMALPDEKTQEIAMYVAQLAETGSVLGLTLVAFCNMWMLLYNRPQIETMLSELQLLILGPNLNSKRIQYFYQQSSNRMRHTTIFFLCACFYYNILPIIELIYELSSEERQVKFKSQSNTWYPWHTKSNTYISLIASFINQVISSWIGVGFIMAGQFLLCFFATQLQLHFDGLAKKLLSLDARNPNAHVELKSLIAYHSHLLRIAASVNSVFNFTFLINFITSTIAICLMGFAMIMIDLAAGFKYSVGLCAFLVFTLFICFNGTQFTTSSEKLLPAAFYNNWYEGDLKYRKMLLFFIMRSCDEQVWRSYNFIPISMATFMSILKFSYQLFTFVRTII